MLVYGFSMFVSVWGCVWAGDVALAGRSLKAVSSFFLSGYSQHSHSNITSREFWETAGRKPGRPSGDFAQTYIKYQTTRMQGQLYKPERDASVLLQEPLNWSQISRRFHTTPKPRSVQRKTFSRQHWPLLDTGNWGIQGKYSVRGKIEHIAKKNNNNNKKGLIKFK